MDSVSLLDAGRNLTAGIKTFGRIGLSARSREQLQTFYDSGTSLFNQLFANAENQEVNNATVILALRSKNASLVSTEITETATSATSGTQVDTQA